MDRVITSHQRANVRHWLNAAICDLYTGLENWRVIHIMGLGEIRRRYSRSKLGQFWQTLSTGIMVTGLAYVWNGVSQSAAGDMPAFIAVSLIIWQLISQTLSEAPTTFVNSSHIFLNQGMPFSTAIYGLAYKQIWIFLHNLPIIGIALLLSAIPAGYRIVLFFPGLALVLITLLWASYVISVVCLRYRDLTQVIQNALFLLMFMSPVLWKPAQMAAEKQYLLYCNPLASLLAVVRKPLLGELPTSFEWAIAIALAFGGFAVALPLIGYCQRRIVYWI